MSKPTIKKPSPLSTCTYYNEQGNLITTYRMRRLQYKINNNLSIQTALFIEYYKMVAAKLHALNANANPAPAKPILDTLDTPDTPDTTSDSSLDTMRF